jgi:hypothetical protein
VDGEGFPYERWELPLFLSMAAMFGYLGGLFIRLFVWIVKVLTPYSIVDREGTYSIQHTAYTIHHTAYTIHHTAYTIHHTASWIVKVLTPYSIVDCEGTYTIQQSGL